ncbi:MAG: glycosyltransferase [Bacillota bacterium]
MRQRLIVSLIIPCRNEGSYLQQTLRSLTEAKTEFSCEIIVVDDGSTDGCCNFLEHNNSGVILLKSFGLGVANARNLGANVARGDFLCFCDAHIIVEDFWLDKLAQPLLEHEADLVCPAIASADRPQAIGYGVTWDENLNWRWLYEQPVAVKYIPLVPGGCLIVRRDVFEDLDGFEKGFRVFGYDDQEFSLKAWLFGYRAAVAPGVKVLHIFRERHPYPVSWLDVIHNLLRLSFLHFSQRRIGKTIELVKIHQDFGRALAGLVLSDVWEKRRAYLARRRYDDDWFMRQFQINY